jgi:hypothetical protein
MNYETGDNPLATAAARAVEARAIRVLAMPQAQAGKQAAKATWRALVEDCLTVEAAGSFDDFIDEFAFCAALKAANSDANHPAAATALFAPPHAWMGLSVPGSRGGGSDSPDNSYTFMPIAHGARYQISGRRHQPAPADTPFTLTDTDSFTSSLSHLDGPDLRVDTDGAFTITIDDAPAGDRANHLQTKPGCRFLFNRDSRSDWRQVPAALTIRRLDPPDAPPLSDEAVAERAAAMMRETIAPIWEIVRLWRSLEPNVIASPRGTGDFGGFVSQKFSMARLLLAEDDAFVMTIGHGAAAFRNVVAEDFWLRTLDYGKITSSMNNTQAIADPGGASTTYVVSRADPGVHNWINPAGLSDVSIICRWQGLPRDPGAQGEATASGLMSRIGDLDRVLPTSMRRITPAERAAQLADRLATFNLRFADHGMGVTVDA